MGTITNNTFNNIYNELVTAMDVAVADVSGTYIANGTSALQGWGGGSGGGNLQVSPGTQWSPNTHWGAGGFADPYTYSRLNSDVSLPRDTIEGWDVTYSYEDEVYSYTRKFTFKAIRHNQDPTVAPDMCTIQYVLTKEMVDMSRNDTHILEEVVERCVHELKENVMDWMLKNDEHLLTLQRVLRLS